MERILHGTFELARFRFNCDDDGDGDGDGNVDDDMVM